jgi:hypothetical protein
MAWSDSSRTSGARNGGARSNLLDLMRNSDFKLIVDERFYDSRARIVAAVNARYTLFELFDSEQSYCDDLKGASLLLCESSVTLVYSSRRLKLSPKWKPFQRVYQQSSGTCFLRL